MEMLIVRHSYTSEVTLGTLYLSNLKLAILEEPWIANPFGPGGQRADGLKRASSVPDGTYELQRHDTPKHPDCWALHNPDLGVWHNGPPPGMPYGRTAILIHTGNTTADIEGCLLVGLRHGNIDDTAAVLESRAAMAQLRARLGTSNHSIVIRPTAGTSEVAHV